ncbi:MULTISPECIES: flagellar biosynthetic protein FliR [Acidiphilium]|uniref:Flagellar biosynthetic protein FliR n=1 Tax=Acidiphilium rubrum TaxID=526 RepID=A0A8G2FEI6_ACIRU|nr:MULTISPECIES: flagellar biosynthetic protein FliR [Acidiphilium]SIQ99591.1 flagellar biosynthetic protein FliR [Acidiphilium rubrum]
MSADAGQALLTNTVFDFLIVFVRVSSMVMVLPGLGASTVPAMAKIGISLALTTIIAPLVAAALPPMPQTPALLVAMIVEQLVVGITIGWLVNTILYALPIAGQAISYQIGLSSVLLPSTDMGAESTLVSSIFSMLLPVLFFSSTLMIVPIIALVHSFHRIPTDFIGQSHGVGLMVLLIKLVIKSVAFEFLLATQIAAPFLAIGMIWQAGLALMAKASPQMQIFFVAAPLQILVGLGMLAALLGPILATWQADAGRMLLHYVAL